ncbi:MAG: short-chain dehydrogenase, partial [Paracoccaceae bacterium]|nr:short-chain dehydrogenase [Paracoccaceae bacterium]
MTNAPVLILGGRSDIGLAIAHRFAAAGHPIQLAARNAEGLAPEKTDLEVRYRVKVTLHEF